MRAVLLAFAIVAIAVCFNSFGIHGRSHRRQLGANLPTIPGDKSTPVHQRIAVKSPSSVAIGWNTYQQLGQPCVQYGTSAKSLSKKTCSQSSVTYPSSRTWTNTVVLNGLTPSTQYYYKIVSTNTSTSTVPFKTARKPGDMTPFSMNTIIDLGVYGEDGYTIKSPAEKRLVPYMSASPDHTTIAQLVKTLPNYELVIHPGDLGYADDWYLKGHNLADGKDAYEAILEQFYDQLSPVSGQRHYMVSPGNHEAACREVGYVPGTCPEGQANFTDFMNRFGALMPTAFDSTSKNKTAVALRQKAKSLAKPPFWYSFDYGGVHVLMFDTETDFTDAPDQPGGSAMLYGGPFGDTKTQQLDFVNADLASVDRSITPWVVVAGHRPWYTTAGDATSHGGCTQCQTAFESIFYRYGVDIGVFGHVHNSQRFLPVYNNTADPAGMNNPKAPMYIVSGGTGNIEGLSAVGDRQSYNAFAYADDFSYASLTFKSKNALQINFIRSSDGSVLDSSTLTKSHNVAFVNQA
jgi:hypothetical protein